MDPEGELVKSLMEVYRKHTGDQESQPVVMAGGTYARACKNAVAFGISMPGQEYPAHEKEEYVDLDHLVLCAKIFADAIVKLSKIG